MKVQAMSMFLRRHVKLFRWVIVVAVAALIGLWMAVNTLSRAAILREALVDTLKDRLDADVELQSFEVKTFPSLRIHGDGLKLRLRNQQNPAPFIEVRHFEVAGGLFGMLKKQRRFRSVELEGLRITIPPRTGDDKQAGTKAATAIAGPVIIDHVTSRDAVLVIVPKNPAKEPKVWAIHNLDLESVGFDRSMPFTATLSNPIPKGDIAATGSFGPWTKGDPGLTPVKGRYSFDHADLGTIDGIGGILTSTGTFDGILSRIMVAGKTSTPDFQLDIGGAAVPLTTTFDAIVDGTNGNTYLQKVDAKLRETPIEAAGEIVSVPNVKGRTVTLDIKVRDGRMEDLLALSVPARKPVMTGRIAMHAAMTLPPGHKKVIDRLELKGRFALEHVAFADATVKTQLVELSRRARGKKPFEATGPVASEMRGQFTMRDGALRLEPVEFAVPGAEVQLVGVYGLRSEQLDFAGTLAMDAPVSEAMGGGIKGFFLKPFDPIFRKNGKGAVVPIVVSGPRDQPKFGLQWSKVLK
jgi:AsmA-like C-terminal region